MSFGWKAPFPRRFGGGARTVVDTFYRAMQNARPEILRSTDTGSEVDIENQMAARMLSVAYRENQRRANQSDPLRLSLDTRIVTFPDGSQLTTSMLERWEAILGVHVPTKSTPAQRRGVVAARFRSLVSVTRSAVEDAARAIFGSWMVGFSELKVTDVDYAGKAIPGTIHAYYGTVSTTFNSFYPGQYDSTKPWRSDLAHVTVQIQPPASTPIADVKAAVQRCLATFDDILPAWMTASVAQWAPGQTQKGWIAGHSMAGLSAA